MPGYSSAFGRALGKLLRNLKDPEWVALQAGKTVTRIYVTNPIRQSVVATIKGHVHHDDGVYIGDFYTDGDGNEYFVAQDGSIYLHIPAEGKEPDYWVKAD